MWVSNVCSWVTICVFFLCAMIRPKKQCFILLRLLVFFFFDLILLLLFPLKRHRRFINPVTKNRTSFFIRSANGDDDESDGDALLDYEFTTVISLLSCEYRVSVVSSSLSRSSDYFRYYCYQTPIDGSSEEIRDQSNIF